MKPLNSVAAPISLLFSAMLMVACAGPKVPDGAARSGKNRIDESSLKKFKHCHHSVFLC